MSDARDAYLFSEFSGEFQEKIFQALLMDHQWAERMYELIDPKHFELEHVTYLAKKYFGYYEAYGAFPSMALLVDIVRTDFNTNGNESLAMLVVKFLKQIKIRPDLGDIEYVKEHTLKFCRRQAMKNALEEAIDLIATDKHEEAVTKIQGANLQGVTDTLGHDFFEEIEGRHANIKRYPIPTGIAELDAEGILNGGLGRGELGIVLACSGVGKSHALVQFGAQAVMAGCNVIHYTLELSEAYTGMRYDAHICGIPFDDVKKHTKMISEIYSSMTGIGRLFIKRFSPGTSIATIRAHIKKLESTKGFKPDMVVIDYLDKMGSISGKGEQWQEQQDTYEEARSLAEELGISLWSASQAGREWADKDIIPMEGAAQSYGKTREADFMLSISRKPSEKQGRGGRAFIAKSRAGRDGIAWTIDLDTALSTLHFVREYIIDEDAIESWDKKDGRVNGTSFDNVDEMKKILKEKWKTLNKTGIVSDVKETVDANT